MGSAYTPGLTVSPDLVVRRTRRLPIHGEVLVQEGATVEPETIVAQAMLPGPLQTIKLGEKLGTDPKEAAASFLLKEGDSVAIGQTIAETKGLFGMFKSTIVSDHAGVVETVSDITGNVLVREASTPVTLSAYIHGTVAEVLPQEGVTVETRCAMVQGIFGVGGEQHGKIRVAVKSGGELLEASHVLSTDAGMILIGGSGMTYEAIARAAEVKAAGIVAGGIRDSDLVKYLGYDIGVAITGQEAIQLTLMVTEGFGHLAMAERTFELFKSLEGKDASMNGATQIRAGVIRPEVIVPSEATAKAHAPEKAFTLSVGTSIRVIREPYFGKLGTVTELPSELRVLESGTEVRVLKAKLQEDGEVLVPRANVEIIAT